MAELCNKNCEGKRKGKNKVKPLLLKSTSYLRVAKELGITENEVIKNMNSCQVKHKRTALMNSTNLIFKFFNPNKAFDHKDECDKTYNARRMVKCDLCERRFKNVQGKNLHKVKFHQLSKTQEEFEIFENKLANVHKKDAQVGTEIETFQDSILRTFKEGRSISVYNRIRSQILKTNANGFKAEQENKMIVAELEKIWSSININFLHLNTLNSKMSFILNEHKDPSQMQGEQHVYYTRRKAADALVQNQSNDSPPRENKNVLTLVKKVIMMHPSLEDFENFAHKYTQNLMLENQKQPLIISEINDSDSDYSIKHVTPINEAESSARLEELNDKRSNNDHSTTTESSQIYTRLRSNRRKNPRLSYSDSKMSTKSCKKKLKNDSLTCVKKSKAVNNVIQREIFPKQHNVELLPNESMSNNTELLQMQHSETYVQAENTESELLDTLKTEEPEINEIKDNEPTSVPLQNATISKKRVFKDDTNFTSTSEEQSFSKKSKRADSTIQNDRKTEARMDGNKSLRTFSLKKKKYALKLGSRKYYLVKKKRFKIGTLIGRHRLHMWSRIRKKQNKHRSRISPNMIVEDFIEEKSTSVEGSASNDTEQNSGTSMTGSSGKIYNNMKDLRIPLVRIDEFPLQGLTKLTRTSDCAKNIKKKASKVQRIGRQRKVKNCKTNLPQDEMPDEKEDIQEIKDCDTIDHSSSVLIDKRSQMSSTPNEVTKTSTAVLRIQGFSVVRNLNSKTSQEQDKLLYQINENGMNLIEDVTLVEADSTMKNGHVSVQMPKCNSKKRTRSELRAIKKRAKLNDYERFDVKNTTKEDQYEKPEKLNRGIISVTNKNTCHVCDKSFSTQKALSEHMFFIHDASFDNSVVSDLLTSYDRESDLSEKSMETYEGTESSDEQMEDFTEVSFTDEENETDKASYDSTTKSQDLLMKNSRNWRCKLCKENFGLLRNYLRHKYYSHNDETVVHICDNCTKVLTSVAMVNVHVCTNVTSWICRRCNLKFPNGISLGRHNINRHLEVVGPHTCNTCNLNFLTNYMLERHRSKEHNSFNNTGKSNATMMYNANDMGASLYQFQLLNTKEFNLSRSLWLTKKEEEADYISNSARVSLKSNQCSCTVCDLICPNKLLMKLHLEKKHNILLDICQLCNDLFPIGKVTWHLIDRHIISDNVHLKQDEPDDKIKLETMEDAQYDLPKILGLKRLVSTYSYQKFTQPTRNAPFNCHVCLRRFLSVQDYKRHYLQEHDTTCILCNVEFEDSIKAMDHRQNTHTSSDAYLWAMQSIVTALYKLKQHNSVLSNLADKIREMSICTGEESLADSRKNKYHNHFSSTFKTEILEVASEYKSITLSMKVERDVAANEVEANTIDNSTDNAVERGTSGAYSLTTTQSVLTNNAVSVILITEEDLLLHKDNIGELASKLCASCTMYSEEYITILLTKYMQNLAKNINK